MGATGSSAKLQIRMFFLVIFRGCLMSTCLSSIFRLAIACENMSVYMTCRFATNTNAPVYTHTSFKPYLNPDLAPEPISITHPRITKVSLTALQLQKTAVGVDVSDFVRRQTSSQTSGSIACLAQTA